MKLTFIGTAHGMPNPTRYRQSILIETDSTAYLFDAGAPVFELLQAQAYNFEKIKAIFISHSHSDHISGLTTLLQSRQIHAHVFLPEAKLVTNYTQEFGVPSSLIQPGLFYQDDVCRVTAFPTTHLTDVAGNRLSNGFLIETAGKRVHITGDYNLQDFPKYAYDTPLDLLVSECAHFDTDALYKEISNCKLGAAAILHVYPPERYKKLTALKSLLPYPLLLPNDGDVLEI